MTKAMIYRECSGNDREYHGHESYTTEDDRVITVAELCCDDRVINDENAWRGAWPGLGDYDCDVLYVFRDKTRFNTVIKSGVVYDHETA